MPLSAKQLEYLALAWECFDSEPKVDYEKFRRLANLASPQSARELLRVAKKKLRAEYGVAGGEGGGEVGPGCTGPAKGVGEGRRSLVAGDAEGEKKKKKKGKNKRAHGAGDGGEDEDGGGLGGEEEEEAGMGGDRDGDVQPAKKKKTKQKVQTQVVKIKAEPGSADDDGDGDELADFEGLLK